MTARETEDAAIAAMAKVSGRSPARRREIARELPALLEPVLRSLNLAAEIAGEPVGAVGHLVTARAALDAVIARATRRGT